MFQYSTLTFILLLFTISKRFCKCGHPNKPFSPEENPVADLFEGDIEINENEEEILEDGVAGAGIIGDHFRWPHHTIPYIISSEYSAKDKKILRGAMKEIEMKTCIRFKPRESEMDFIFIQDGPGCSSSVGRRKTGRQDVTLSIKGGCVKHGVAIHELVHSIGFWHEQSRTDRDKYIEIKVANINEDKLHNFNAYTSKDINDFGVPYDYNSVMHYHDTAFISAQALKNHEKTIVPRKPGVTIGQRRYLSELDALKINRMYCPQQVDEEVLSKYLNKLTTTTSRTTTTKKPFKEYIKEQLKKQNQAYSKFHLGNLNSLDYDYN